MQTNEERARTQAALAAHISGMDLVITTAQIPGRPAPRLITAEMVRSMRPGAVVVDLACPGAAALLGEEPYLIGLGEAVADAVGEYFTAVP
jgi:H+-translocating NAD(P) transhydrogenase subunit alpha